MDVGTQQVRLHYFEATQSSCSLVDYSSLAHVIGPPLYISEDNVYFYYKTNNLQIKYVLL